MNKLRGKIVKIEKGGELSFFTINSFDAPVYAFVVGEEADEFKEGEEVFALFKENETVLAEEGSGNVFLENEFVCEIKEMKRENFLTRVRLSFLECEIVSIISSRFFKESDLKVGKKMRVLVKASQMTLMKVDNG